MLESEQGVRHACPDGPLGARPFEAARRLWVRPFDSRLRGIDALAGLKWDRAHTKPHSYPTRTPD